MNKQDRKDIEELQELAGIDPKEYTPAKKRMRKMKKDVTDAAVSVVGVGLSPILIPIGYLMWKQYEYGVKLGIYREPDPKVGLERNERFALKRYESHKQRVARLKSVYESKHN